MEVCILCRMMNVFPGVAKCLMLGKKLFCKTKRLVTGGSCMRRKWRLHLRWDYTSRVIISSGGIGWFQCMFSVSLCFRWEGQHVSLMRRPDLTWHVALLWAVSRPKLKPPVLTHTLLETEGWAPPYSSWHPTPAPNARNSCRSGRNCLWTLSFHSFWFQ